MPRCCSSTWLEGKRKTKSAREKCPFRALLCYGPMLAARAVKLAHKAGERFDGFGRDGVVERDAHAANSAVAGGANQAGRGSFPRELLFEAFVPAAHAEDHVHLRA